MDPVLLGVIVAAIGGAMGYLGLVRKLSGRIQTTEAAQLWAEADRMRQEYREEIARLQGVIDRYERRLVEVEQRNTKLAKENYGLIEKIKELEAENQRIREECNQLTQDNQRIRTEADGLRARVMELEIGRSG